MSKSIFKLLFVTLLLTIALPFSIAWGRDASVLKQASQTEDALPQLTTAAVTATLALPGRAVVSARHNHWVIDSIPPLDGPNQEVNPMDSFLGALATCGMFVYEKAAQELGIPLEQISAVAQGDFAPQGIRDGSVDPRVRAFRVLIQMVGPDKVQAEQLRQQFQTRCPIYTTLSLAAPIDIIHVGIDDVAGVLLQIDFAYDVPTEDFVATVSPLAEQFAQTAGLRWKIWALNEEESRFNGILLFDDMDGLQAFLESDLAETVTTHPALSDFHITPYTILAAETQATRGPASAMLANKMIGGEEVSNVGTLLRINFKYNVSTADFITAVSPLAPDFAASEGLRWKIWALNEEDSSFSGLLYFDSTDAMQAFLESDLAATVMGHPALSDFSVTPFSIMAAETAITHGPIQ